MADVRAYECRVKGSEYASTIHSTSASKARYRYFLDLDDCYPDLRLIDIEVRSLGGPRSDAEFMRTARYRGVEFARVGMAVKVGGYDGAIVGKNSSANFDVLMFAGPWAGVVMNVHPNTEIQYFDASGVEIKAVA